MKWENPKLIPMSAHVHGAEINSCYVGSGATDCSTGISTSTNCHTGITADGVCSAIGNAPG